MEKSFSKDLVSWYRKNARDLPWRKTSDPYRIWISEVMLQQTTVAAVIPYYEKWFTVFPSIESLAQAPQQKVLNIWKGLGYYQRAKNLQKAASLILEQHGGQVPADPLALRKLPGFGPYTVGAVLSIAFDQRQPIIDANVRRVIMRYLSLEGPAVPSVDPQILKFLDQVQPHKQNNIFNQSMMELGALVCRGKEPLCLACPLKKGCQAFHKNLQEAIPVVKKKIIKDVQVAIGVIERKGLFYIQKRPSQGLFADLWEFPGGKIESGETPEQAVARELKEELGVQVSSSEKLFEVTQLYTQFRARLYVFSCELQSDPPVNAAHKWVKLNALSKYPMPSGSVKILDKLLAQSNS